MEASSMRALRPIVAVHLRDRTYASIRQAIVAGELGAGDPVRDRVLAEALGVSRTPVREALHRLEHTGLVEPRGRSGWMVTAFTEQDVRELFELRRALEPLGLDRLKETPDHPAIAKIASFFDDFDHPVDRDRYEEYFAHDRGFHKLIVECADNLRLGHFYGVIEDHIDRGRHFLSTAAAGRVDANLDEHRAVARAVADGDFDRARAELLHHLDLGEELMIEQMRRQAAGR
jgi:DNA-binding GntR family transcriptional regulator